VISGPCWWQRSRRWSKADHGITLGLFSDKQPYLGGTLARHGKGSAARSALDFGGNPPHIEYAAHERGRLLLPLVDALRVLGQSLDVMNVRTERSILGLLCGGLSSEYIPIRNSNRFPAQCLHRDAVNRRFNCLVIEMGSPRLSSLFSHRQRVSFEIYCSVGFDDCFVVRSDVFTLDRHFSPVGVSMGR